MASAVIALGTNDGRVRVVHTGSGEVRLDVQAHTDEVGCVALSPDGHTLATSGWDRSTKLWEVSNGEEKLKLRSHDGKGLCSCEVNEHGQCSAFDLHCKLFAHAPAVTVMSFSGTGQSLATASVDKNLIVWNVISGAAEHRFLGHTHSIKALAFTRDGALLASGGEDKRILIWDMSSGKLLQALEGAHTGGETPVMPGYKWGGVRSLAFSPDGRRLRSGGDEHQVKVWEVPIREDAEHDSSFAPHRESSARVPCAEPLRTLEIVSVPGDGVVSIALERLELAAMCEEASWVRECARLQSGRRGVQVSEQCLTLGQAAMQAVPSGLRLNTLAFGSDCRQDERGLAFAMALHERLGAASWVGSLEVGVMRMVLEKCS